MENLLLISIIDILSVGLIIILIILVRQKKSKTKPELRNNNINGSEVQLQKKGSSKITTKKGGIFDQKTNPIIREKAATWTTSSSYEEDINKLNINELLDAKPKIILEQKKDNNTKLKTGPKIQILLVDDSLVVRKYVGDLLKKDNYDIVLKNDGWDAITYLNSTSQKPDIIISDIEMPNMNGFQLIEAIRKEKQFKFVPILVISAHAESHLKLMENETIQGFIKKPFEDSDLLEQVKYLLEI
jgi:CheY-like chemotaxis protein